MPSTPGPLLDPALLLAGAAVSQASTPTAVLAERLASQRRTAQGDTVSALVRLMVAHDAGAIGELHGSFHPRIAQAASGKVRSSLMKPGFTLAF